MSEIDDLEAYETPAGHPVDKHTAQAFKNYGNRYRNARERQAMRNKAAARRDQEIFDRMGLPKGSGT
jgi:hypothetical protein